MRVIVPVEFTSANLISTSVPEPDTGSAWAAYSSATVYREGERATQAGQTYQSMRSLNLNNPLPASAALNTEWWTVVTEVAYSAASAYATGARVVNTSTHRVYEALQPVTNGATSPLPVYPLEETDFWLDVGVSNRWACLDLSRNTQTAVPGPLTLVLAPQVRVNSLALMGLDCDAATITTSSGYSLTKTLLGKPARNYYQYFFDPFAYERSLVVFDLPPNSGMTITITLTKASGPVRLGSVVVGNFAYLGAAQYNAVSDTLNFSSVDRDPYGNAKLVRRLSVPKTSQKLRIDKHLVNGARAARTALNAVPAVWCGLDDLSDDPYYEALLVLGVYKTFSIDLASYVQAEINLELEEI